MNADGRVVVEWMVQPLSGEMVDNNCRKVETTIIMLDVKMR